DALAIYGATRTSDRHVARCEGEALEILSHLTIESLSVLFLCCDQHRHLHSFPTRRSSDLVRTAVGSSRIKMSTPRYKAFRISTRSEEHTSELQSRVDLVCRLLLEKKNRMVVHRYRAGRRKLGEEASLRLVSD